MTSKAQLPVLPHGSPTSLSGLSETFSFHSSPEAFITSRVLAFRGSHPDLANSRTPIRAKVLNRNVAVISSYDQVKQILCRSKEKSSDFGASQAYEELMAPFFPPPNLLLSDLPAHEPMKKAWVVRMESLPGEFRVFIQDSVLEHFRSIESGTLIDLYESMKTLSWKILLGIFLFSSNEHGTSREDLAEIESLQETLLRGQFSLFPVSINTRFWRSPRAKGLEARKKLQETLRARVANAGTGCPFAMKEGLEKDDVASHLLLFTSSLAVKALSSILTALLLNLYIFPSQDSGEKTSLAARVLSLVNHDDQDALLYSILFETERISPPVVGIMRRSSSEVILTSGRENTPDTLIPESWDVWLYFVGAARDPAVFGSTADTFVPERYYKSPDETRQSFAFGDGPKSCLGADLMREVAMIVAKTCLGTLLEDSRLDMTVDIQAKTKHIPRGVKGWLGWEADVRPEEWARDMKQLPTQRPAKAVHVTIKHNIT